MDHQGLLLRTMQAADEARASGFSNFAKALDHITAQLLEETDRLNSSASSTPDEVEMS